MTAISIPNSVKSIGLQAFINCPGLTYVFVPNSVISIGSFAFSECSGLVTLTISESLKELGLGVWWNCPGIRNVYYAAEHPVASDEVQFDQAVYNNAVLYLRKSTLAEAAAVKPWNLFRQRKSYDFDAGIDGISAIDPDFPVEVYDLRGVHVASGTDCLPAGVYIVRQGAMTSKIIVR